MFAGETGDRRTFVNRFGWADPLQERYLKDPMAKEGRHQAGATEQSVIVKKRQQDAQDWLNLNTRP